MNSLALVTGASSGIGRALCDILASQGISLIIHGRDHLKLEQAAELLRLKVPVQIVCADLNNKTERGCLIEIIRKRKPDLIVNNAGLGHYGKAIDTGTEQQLQILEVNGMSVLELTLESAKALKEAKQHGVIMNVSSVAGFFVFPYSAIYAASKSFVNEFSQALDYELRAEGIRVLTACPGMVDTNFRVRAGGIKLTDKGSVMTATYAAEQIWKQICALKPLHIFDWKYRLAAFVRPLIPQSLYVKFLMKSIKNRTL